MKEKMFKKIEEENKKLPFESIYEDFKYEILRPCMRTSSVFHLCGYVYLTNDYKGINIENISVHGGITCDEIIDGQRVIGFDCAHFGDICSGFDLNYSETFKCKSSYKDFEYVQNECFELIKQIKNYNMKEEMIEFVREKVVLANNQECKTFEEAILKLHSDIFYRSDLENNFERMKNAIYVRYEINLERVLVALNFRNVEVQIESEAEFIQFFIGTFGRSDTFRWRPHKPLEEQSEETIEKIAKILRYVE